MKYSIALFGHWKHRYEIREKQAKRIVIPKGINFLGIEEFEEKEVNKVVARLSSPPDYDLNPDKYFLYEVTGLEKRCVPGDIVAFKPYEQRDKWTPTERTEFLIVTIETDRKMMEGLFEPQWDVDTYFPYNPLSFEDWIKNTEELLKQARNKALAFRKWNETDREKEYQDYLDNCEHASMYPRGTIKKRRMTVPLESLKEKDVDVGRMLDTNTLYDPQPDIDLYVTNDKLKERSVVESDGLRLIDPVLRRN